MLHAAVRWTLKAAGGCALTLGAVAAAWVLSNWRDADPRPVPAALQPAPPTLAPERNAQFLLHGLYAPPDADPLAVGQRRWREEGERMQAAVRHANDPSAPAPAPESAADPRRLPAVHGAPWDCGATEAGCAARRLAQADALRRQHATAAATWGPRCERLIDDGLRYEEQWFDGPAPWSSALPHATACSAWFTATAVLAAAGGDAAALRRALQRSDTYHARLLEGSRSLVGHLIAFRMAYRHLDTLTALAPRDAALAADAAQWLAAWPDVRTGARRALASEATYGRHVVGDLLTHCRMEPPAEAAVERTPLADRATAWLCRHRIGWHPERTRQDFDAYWLRLLGTLDGEGWSSALAAPPGVPELAEIRPRWVNTGGRLLFDVAESAGAAPHRDHIARFADHELHRTAARLALRAAAERVAPAERAAWLARQPLPAEQRERIAIDTGGGALTANPFRQTLGSWDPARDAVRIALPA